jgi:hypothetical protein
VCRVHGGSAPQVRLAARRRVLAERVFMAYLDWQDVHDTDHHRPGQRCSLREADALGRIAIAEREAGGTRRRRQTARGAAGRGAPAAPRWS